MRYGRKDAMGPESVQPEGNLPGIPDNSFSLIGIMWSWVKCGAVKHVQLRVASLIVLSHVNDLPICCSPCPRLVCAVKGCSTLDVSPA